MTGLYYNEDSKKIAIQLAGVVLIPLGAGLKYLTNKREMAR